MGKTGYRKKQIKKTPISKIIILVVIFIMIGIFVGVQKRRDKYALLNLLFHMQKIYLSMEHMLFWNYMENTIIMILELLPHLVKYLKDYQI